MLRAVYAPKVSGGMRLLNVTRTMPLHSSTHFSSLTAQARGRFLQGVRAAHWVTPSLPPGCSLETLARARTLQQMPLLNQLPRVSSPAACLQLLCSGGLGPVAWHSAILPYCNGCSVSDLGPLPVGATLHALAGAWLYGPIMCSRLCCRCYWDAPSPGRTGHGSLANCSQHPVEQAAG